MSDLNIFAEVLRSRGRSNSLHDVNRAADLIDQLDATKRALALAVDMLAPHEPGDSRAVSAYFVALAAVSVGDTSPEVMQIIDLPRSADFWPTPVPVEIEITVS
jgi:hypothetical protein